MLTGLRSRKHIHPFALHRPDSLAGLARLRRDLPAAALMAGGLDLINRLKWGEPVANVIHLRAVPGLDGISLADGRLRLGALVTHAALAESATVATALPTLAALWGAVANPRIRDAGTLGGNLLADNPGYDGAPAMLALGAHAEWLLTDGTRATLPFAPVPPPGGVLLSLDMPAGPDHALFADRSLRPVLTAWLGLTTRAGVVVRARLGLGGGWPTALALDIPGAAGCPRSRLGAAAAALATATAAALPEPITDGIAGAAHRRRMAAVLAQRLLTSAAA